MVLRQNRRKGKKSKILNCVKIEGRIVVSDTPFLKQMMCGVHSEEGFTAVSSTVFHQSQMVKFSFWQKHGKLPKEVNFSF
jgi:hypothetical protein